MTALTYRFATPAQWATATTTGLQLADGALVPARPLGLPPVTIAAPGVRAPAIGPDGTLYWVAGGTLWWRTPGADARTLGSQGELATATRLVAGRRWLWARLDDGALLRVEIASFALDRWIAGDWRDIASDGHDGVWALDGNGALHRWDAKGCASAADGSVPPALALASLRAPERLVVLDAGGARLDLVDPTRPGIRAVPLDSPADLVASDRGDRLFVAVRGGATVRVLTGDARPLGVVDFAPWLGAAGVTALAARGDVLLVASGDRLLVVDAARGGTAPGATGRVITPTLHSPPDGSTGGWLRADLVADLPAGATLVIRAISAATAAQASDIAAALADPALAPDARWRAAVGLAAVPERIVTYAAPTPGISAPLFDQAEYLWLAIELTASVAGARPALASLTVTAPDEGLARYVPAVFVADLSGRDPHSGDPSGFFRSLLGLLGTTTAGLDATIARLGARIAAETATEDELATVAGWLDLPWDDTLSLARKRALVTAAAPLAATRGSRAGLRALLAALMPDAVVRIRDLDADFGAGRLGGAACGGSALPLFLTGLRRDATVLGRRARLGIARLPCGSGDATGVARWGRIVLVEITADPASRAALEAILPRLVAAVTPVGIKLRLRWRTDGRTRLDGAARFDPALRLDGRSRLGRGALGAGRRRSDDDLDAGLRLA